MLDKLELLQRGRREAPESTGMDCAMSRAAPPLQSLTPMEPRAKIERSQKDPRVVGPLGWAGLAGFFKFPGYRLDHANNSFDLKPARLHSIEALRGFAALAVTWFHLTNSYPP